MSNTDKDPVTDSPTTEVSKAAIRSRKTKERALLAVGVLAMFIAVAIVMTATRGDGKATVTTPTTGTAPAIPVAESQKVAEDYRAFWGAYLAAASPMTPESPVLAQHATGEEYQKLVNSFSGAKASNVVFKGTVDLEPRIDFVMGTSASISDCIVDHTGVYDATTGERKDEDDPQRRKSTASMQLVDGTWKVSKLTSGGLGCTAP